MSFLSSDNILLVKRALGEYLPECYATYADLKSSMAGWLRVYPLRHQVGTRGFLERTNAAYVRWYLLNSYPRDFLPTDDQTKIRPDPSWVDNNGVGWAPGSALDRLSQVQLGNLRVADYCSPADAYFMLGSLNRRRDPPPRPPMKFKECSGHCDGRACSCSGSVNLSAGKYTEPDDGTIVRNPSTRPRYGDRRKYEIPRPPPSYYDVQYLTEFDSSRTRVVDMAPTVCKGGLANYRNRLLNMH